MRCPCLSSCLSKPLRAWHQTAAIYAASASLVKSVPSKHATMSGFCLVSLVSCLLSFVVIFCAVASQSSWDCYAGNNAYTLTCANCTSSATPLAAVNWWRTAGGKGAMAGIIGTPCAIWRALTRIVCQPVIGGCEAFNL